MGLGYCPKKQRGALRRDTGEREKKKKRIGEGNKEKKRGPER